jgi:WD40 repeat protein
LGGHGEYLVVDDGGRPRIWEVATQSELDVEFRDIVSAFAPSPDGHQLAVIERTRGERTYWIRVRDIASGGVVREWRHPERGDWLQWRPRGLTAGNDASAWIYDPQSGELIRREPIEKRLFALSPDGRLVAVSLGADVIQVRAVANGTEVARTSHDAELAGLSFRPDGRSLTTVDRVARRIRVWQFDGDASYAQLREESAITRVEFTTDSSQLITTTDRSASAWRLPRTGEDPTLQRQEAPDIGAREQSRVEFTDARCGAKSSILTAYAADDDPAPRRVTVDAGILSATASWNGNRLAVLAGTGSTRGGCQRRLEVWNLRTGAQLATRVFDPVLDSQSATYLQFAGDDRFLVVGMRSGVEIVDADGLTAVATIYHPGVTVTAMLGGGTLTATLGTDGLVRIWNAEGQNEIARIESIRSTKALALSSDQRWLAALEEAGTVRVWALAPDDVIQQACRWLEAPCP